MVKIIDTLLGKSASHADDEYMELDLASYEEHGSGPALLVKIATMAVVISPVTGAPMSPIIT